MVYFVWEELGEVRIVGKELGSVGVLSDPIGGKVSHDVEGIGSVGSGGKD